MPVKKWREEVMSLLLSTGFNRVPALRRSNRKEFLLATDFPQKADGKAVEKFLDEAGRAGWRTIIADGWIHLDRPAVYEGADAAPVQGSEAACCLSLLERQGTKTSQSDGSSERALLKALEEGPAAYERICGVLHTRWAESMRTKKGIPDIDKRFFGGKEIP